MVTIIVIRAQSLTTYVATQSKKQHHETQGMAIGPVDIKGNNNKVTISQGQAQATDQNSDNGNSQSSIAAVGSREWYSQPCDSCYSKL
jgi:hypothetical protein